MPICTATVPTPPDTGDQDPLTRLKIGSLRAVGFEMAMAAHIYPLLDSYIYGFAMTQMNLPFENTKEVTEVAQSMLQAFPVNEFPHLAAFITEHAMKPAYDYANEFEWGLDVILDGLERVQDKA